MICKCALLLLTMGAKFNRRAPTGAFENGRAVKLPTAQRERLGRRIWNVCRPNPH
jgi:hypothetical protein